MNVTKGKEKANIFFVCYFHHAMDGHNGWNCCGSFIYHQRPPCYEIQETSNTMIWSVKKFKPILRSCSIHPIISWQWIMLYPLPGCHPLPWQALPAWRQALKAWEHQHFTIIEHSEKMLLFVQFLPCVPLPSKEAPIPCHSIQNSW